MRILFLTHYFPPEVNAPASRVYEMAEHWVRAGAEVTVLTCAPNAPSGRLFPGYRNRLWQHETLDGINVVRVWSFLAANKGAVLRMMNYLSYMGAASLAAPFLRRPDVVIATSPQLFCGWAGVWAHWMRRCPLILEIRDMWAESIASLTSHKRGPLTRVLEAIEFRLYRMTPHLVTVGPGYRQVLVEKGLDPANIEIITNGVDLDFYQPQAPDAELRSQWKLENKFVCCYAGTTGMAHRLDVVVRAAEILRAQGDDRIRFVIAGDGADRENLQAEIRSAQLSNVLLLGRQPKEMMPKLYALSDCCLVHLRKVPLFETVIPSKLFEVMAMQLPIVLGVRGQAQTLIEQAGTGVCIEPEDATQLARAVQQLADDPDAARRIGRAGREFVAAHYDRSVLAQNYLDLIRKVVEQKRGPSAALGTEDIAGSHPSTAARR